MQLVFCQKCRNPVAKLAPGSRAEIKCKTCGIKTYFEVQPEMPPARTFAASGRSSKV